MFTYIRRLASAAMLLLSVFGSVNSIAGPVLYGVTGHNDRDSYLYTINPITGAISLIGYTGLDAVTGIDFDPTTGVLYGVRSGGSDEQQLLTINTSTGAATVIGATNAKIPDISFTPDGLLRGWSADSNSSIIIDKTTAAITSVATGLSSAGTGVAWQDASHNYIKHENALYSVNTNTGADTFLGVLVHETFQKMRNMLENDPNGGLISSDRRTFYHIDTDTLDVTTLGTVSGDIEFSAIAYSTGVVDEPPAIALLGLALGGLGWYRRRLPIAEKPIKVVSSAVII